jgi:hypothetical protein
MLHKKKNEKAIPLVQNAQKVRVKETKWEQL